jgi:ADP-ribosyl-[dinitrogen reductase] hydrolase
MALCLAIRLAERDEFDARDQMERYCRWRDTGYFSSTGAAFDIGGTVRASLEKYRRTGEPFAGNDNPLAAGKGCILRLAPVPMFYFPDIDKAERFASESCRTTHGATECLDASRLFSRIIIRALSGRTKDDALFADGEKFIGSSNIQAIARGEFRRKHEKEIIGSGYVVDCLEAAMWCFLCKDSFEAAILTAANLGDDADTTSAVCGQVAGAFYGASGIPTGWLEKLAMRAKITALADRLLEQATRNKIL